ncbi:MATE family efflux transporter [Brevibacillus nitrificans]|uniref:MATE family efflux transporter n=1 Tax=Brevibacillus nitrificans TaxID=651560 RepID=UPI00285A4FE1|nr:MATE family efflux transporter [Brevibacillus nitrificans]MDR7313770.1 putative MATE family efflux protein [Brevibacillus nitrificans]
MNQLFKDWKALIMLAIPMIIASLSDILLNAVNTGFVGQLGTVSLASVLTAGAIYSVITTLIGALAVGFQIIAARQFGAGDREEVSKTFLHMAVLIFIAVLISILILWFCRPIVQMISSDPAVVNEAITFLRVRMIGLVFFGAALICRMTLDASKQSKWGMYSSLVSNIFNAIGDYFLIFGVGQLQPMGIQGAALSSSIANLIGFLFFVWVLWRIKPIPLPSIKLVRSQFSSILRLSSPEMLNSTFDYVGNLLFTAVIGILGTSMLAGGRITFMFVMILFHITLIMGFALQITMGNMIGKGDLQSMKRVFTNGRLLSLAISFVLGTLVAVGSRGLLSIFSTSLEVIQDTVGAIIVLAITVPLMAWTNVNTAAMRAHSNTKWVMYINLSAVWLVQLPIGWLVGIYLNGGLVGVYTGYLCYFLVRAVVSHFFAIRLINNKLQPKIEGIRVR